MLNTMINKCKILAIRNQFYRRSIIKGNVTFFSTARCINEGARENIHIGHHCLIGCNLVSRFNGKISIGNNVYIGGNTSIYCKEAVEIGNEVIISNNVFIMDNNNHPTSPAARKQMSLADDYITNELWSWKNADSAKVTIEDNVWIGRDVRILKGVTIGTGAIVALGSIVTRNVPKYCIVAGNPARIVKHLEPLEN